MYRQMLGNNARRRQAIPTPANVFEFGADDTLVGSLFPGGTALELVTPTKVRTTVAAADKAEAQMPANQTIPPSSGMLVIPAAHTGIVGYELDVLLPDLASTTFDGVFFGLLSITDQNGFQFAPTVWWNGTLSRWEFGDLGTNNIVLGAGGSYRLAVDNNYGTDDVTIRSGVTAITYAQINPPTAESFPVVQTQQIITDAGTALGLEVTFELIQDADDFTETHIGSTVALDDALIVKA